MAVRKLTDYHKRLLRTNTGVTHSRQVQITIPNNPGIVPPEVKFIDQADLRYARIIGMEVIVNEDLAQGSELAGTVIPAANLKYFAITLECNDGDIRDDKSGIKTGRFRATNQNIHWQPLVTLHRAIGYGGGALIGVKSLLEFDNLFVTWQKSFLTVNPTAPITGGSSILGKCVLFNVYYTFRSITGGLIKQ